MWYGRNHGTRMCQFKTTNGMKLSLRIQLSIQMCYRLRNRVKSSIFNLHLFCFLIANISLFTPSLWDSVFTNPVTVTSQAIVNVRIHRLYPQGFRLLLKIIFVINSFFNVERTKKLKEHSTIFTHYTSHLPLNSHNFPTSHHHLNQRSLVETMALPYMKQIILIQLWSVHYGISKPWQVRMNHCLQIFINK